MTNTNNPIDNFVDYVTEAAGRRIRSSIDGTLSTATKKELQQYDRILERGLALMKDPKYDRMVHKLMDHHRKDMLAFFDAKCKEILNNQELLTKAIWYLEKLVEDDLVRMILGPEGGN